MPYQPQAIANNLLDIADSSGSALSPMKMQKLVYFSHGWHLGLGHGPLSNEQAEAWQWGPVFPSLYHALKVWGSGPIQERITMVTFSLPQPGARRKRKVITPSIDDAHHFPLALLKRVWEVYGDMSASQLSALSHVPDGPWYKARQLVYTEVILDDAIADYFKSKVAASDG